MTTQYKPYTLKDFNNLKDNTTTMKLGGLGPNIGGPEWQEAVEKQRKVVYYDRERRIKSKNKVIPLDRSKDNSMFSLNEVLKNIEEEEADELES